MNLLVRVLSRVLGRLPIGTLQLLHNKGRLAAAIAGVAFADVLVFVQLGLAGSLDASVRKPYLQFDPDLVLVSAADANTLDDGSNVPRSALFQALAVPDVADGTGLYAGKVVWQTADGESASIQVLALDPGHADLLVAPLDGQLDALTLANAVLVDRSTRFMDTSRFEGASLEDPVVFELQHREMRAVGTFEQGGGFAGDGAMWVSSNTFLSLFPQRRAGAPDHLLLRLAPDADRRSTLLALAHRLPDTRIQPIRDAMEAASAYQSTQRPTGIIFAYGVFIGIAVGAVIAYQVLSTDVADHLSEYATFKAMGYGWPFFAGLILEEALLLALIGFVPGLGGGLLFYAGLRRAAKIPIAMTTTRVVAVFVGTLLACGVSGLLAMRRLTAADPADLF